MTYFSTEPLPSSPDSSDIRRLRNLFPIGNCQRIAGPPLPPPAQTEALRNEGPVPYLLERLERLAYGERTSGGNPPPVETYRTEPGPAGDVYRAICDGIPASTELKLIKCRHLEAQLLFLLRNKHRLGIDPETGEPRE